MQKGQLLAKKKRLLKNSGSVYEKKEKRVYTEEKVKRKLEKNNFFHIELACSHMDADSLSHKVTCVLENLHNF